MFFYCADRGSAEQILENYINRKSASNASVELTPQREKVRGSSTRRRLSKASFDKRHVVQVSGSDVDERRNCPFDTAVSVQLQRAVRRISKALGEARISRNNSNPAESTAQNSRSLSICIR